MRSKSELGDRLDCKFHLIAPGSAEVGPAPTGGTSITVQHINRENIPRLRRQAQRVSVSMEELVHYPKPTEAFAGHFGEKHCVELPTPARRGHRPLSFSSEDEARPLPSRRNARKVVGIAFKLFVP